MATTIFLDTTLLWLLVHPAGGEAALKLRGLIAKRLRAGDQLAIAEICDYEARRELLRRSAAKQVANLDALIAESTYVPLDTPTMRDAAAHWGYLRNTGQKTADDAALDGDVILGVQAVRFSADHLVATANTEHLKRVCNAETWTDL